MSESPPGPVDISRFSELSDGDKDSMVELIQLYLTKTGEQMLDLEKALKRNSASEVVRIAHSLVGSNAMVGLTALVGALRELEAAGEKQDMPFANQVFSSFCDQFKGVHASLTQTIADLTSNDVGK